jgi:ribosomal protein L11 methylase PrmA
VVHADFHTLDDLKHWYGPARFADHVTRATLYSLLDFGTGSVIQPVASAMSGAKKVMGMDPYPALLAGLVKPGGRLFGGGILDIKADHTIIALEEQGKK